MPHKLILVPRMGMPRQLQLSCGGIFFQSLGQFHLPRSIWGEPAHEMDWLWECLQPLEEGIANPTSLCRPALAMCLASSQCSSLMHPSSCLWGSTLGATASSPLETCSTTFRISASGDLKRVHTEGCLGADLAISNSDPQEWLWCSFLCMVATLWTCVPTGTGPIPISGQCSSLGLPL